jgi:hypothetical protein
MGARVAELGEERPGDRLEALDVSGRQLPPPVAQAGRRRLCQARVIRERAHVHAPVVLEHLRLEGEAEEGAHVPQARLRVGHEVLVAQLEIARSS